MNEQAEPESVDEEVQAEIAVKIVHLLGIYPIISPTMLQGALGPQVKAGIWRPVLTQLIEEGKVVEESVSMLTPTERYNTYTKLSLADAQ